MHPQFSLDVNALLRRKIHEKFSIGTIGIWAIVLTLNNGAQINMCVMYFV